MEPEYRQSLHGSNPVFLIGSCRRPGLVASATSGPSHYAAKRVITSTALWAKCEDQSRRFDKASYSRQDARSIATGNQPANRAWEFEYGSNRRASVCIPRGSGELHTKCGRKAEAIRSKQDPTKKIKLGVLLETQLEAMRQFATFTGVLAGFSFTALLQLVSLNDKRRIVGATASAFALATCLLLYSLVGFFLSALQLGASMKSAFADQTFGALASYLVVLSIMCLAGIVVLLLGVALAGWIRSRRVGIISTAFAVLAFAGIVMIIRFLMILPL